MRDRVTAFHVSTPASLSTAVRKAHNLLADETVVVDRISVVIDDRDTIAALLDAETTDELGSLPNTVEVAVCNNTLSRTTIPHDDLPSRAEVVASGVGELTRLQHDGAAYIRLYD